MLEVLSTRSGFNSAVAQINKTLGIYDAMGDHGNLGDLLRKTGNEDLAGEGTALLLRMLLVDKLGYRAVSTNLPRTAADLSPLADEFARWKGVDIVAAYHHPDLGLLVANPKNPLQLENFAPLRKRELLVIYAGRCRGTLSSSAGESCLKAAKIAAALFEGAKISDQRSAVSAELLRGNFTVKKLKNAAVKARKSAVKGPKRASGTVAALRGASPDIPAAGKQPVRMTPLYSVTVTNELFHNGNVEAWKRIIASYQARYPELQVYIYYEGERILDINSLFMWGKVKHGFSIQFAVAGNGSRDVARLQRYLGQGASNQFEVFLRNAAGTVLKLFG